ncbi:MAG TPA: NADH-quinone oxidoreductase subunit C [Actinophytocola sp.]|jgi:Ni,Fe-hydrogenase III large subunit|uniref:hydrogenase large subunit n=1 Tax=Actinophytocola sp. TaxID=1872138 RepID=UPI002F91DF3B
MTSDTTPGITPTPGPPGEPAGTNRTALTISPDDLPARAKSLLDKGYRVALIAGHEDVGGIGLRAVYLFTAADPDRRVELHVPVPRDTPAVPSLAGMSSLAARFEREMHDLFGIVTLGHPVPHRLVRHGHWPRGWYPMLAAAGEPPEFAAAEVPAPVDESEVSLGPVHAGVTEPSRYRLTVDGERVTAVGGRLWYVHKGIERLFQGRTPADGIELAERISGDTAVGHTLAYCLAVEDAEGHEVDPDVQRIRSILLELERLYNHAADMGGLCGDAGHGVLDAHAQGIREELLRINDEVTGHRLLRGAIHPGGVAIRRLPHPDRLAELATEVASLVALALESSVIVDRFTGTAVLTVEQAAACEALGYVARASGLTVDARHDHPFLPADPPRAYDRTEGDVMARFLARAAEFADSVRLIAALREEGFAASAEPPQARRAEASTGVGIVEGWRGTITHRVELSEEGVLTRVKVVDPSFVNWAALPLALTGIDVADFPLANRSFNLSLAGNDL